MPHSSIRDNHTHGTVGAYLKDHITDHSNVSIVSAYFTIFAYQHLKENMDNINDLRFLFGEPTFIKSIDADKTNVREFKIEDDNLVIATEKVIGQKAVALQCCQWLRDKAQIRSMVKPNFLHGKLYHITQPSGIEKAIAGSSNFTVNGLGLGGNKNIELNLVIDSDRDRKELKQWFDELWNDKTGLVEDVKEEVLNYLEQLYRENSPEFVYFKTLYHIFGDYLNEQNQAGLFNEKTGFFNTEIWSQLYNFQQDGVKGAINKINKHNGCIIADSVGLGKTFEALAVIKYFELLNYRVLVICPKKLAGNWTIYQATQNHALNPFKTDRFNYTVLFHTDMGRTTGRSNANGIDLDNFNWSAYDLIVIDESHNFRGNPLEKISADGTVKSNRAQWLMEKVIKQGSKTKVLMLSATPVNNTLRDLRNQIAFITEGKEDALLECCKIKDISQLLKNTQSQFSLWVKDNNKSMKPLLEKLDSGFFKLLDELTIARSRKHIVNFYGSNAAVKFPHRLKPKSVYPGIDLAEQFPSYDSINQQILKYKLSIFTPSSYVKADKQEKYEVLAGKQISAFTQADRENVLIGMMKINYLKRLESSIKSFDISISRTLEKIETLEEKIAQFKRSPTQLLAIENLLPDEDELDEEDLEQCQVGKKLKFDLADLELDRWLIDLQSDKVALAHLHDNALKVTPEQDAKLHELKALITAKINQPINTNNKKVIIFTAFADTANYLYNTLKAWYTKEFNLECALICGSMTQTTLGKNDYDSILVNFSPLSKNRAKMASVKETKSIDLLIATDCISEGQNLQDCDTLINYDIHWNPVRIIQRFGRIDRLGSINESIQLVNFWPTPDLDNYLNLKERVESRMALVDMTATGEDNILNTEQLHELVENDLSYRNQQLKKLKEEVLDLEDMDEGVSLTDFTMDDFRIELTNFLDTHKKHLHDSPLGLYAVVPAPGGEYANCYHKQEFKESAKNSIKPGVIFCLKQKQASEGNAAINPLASYFLAYIRMDGTISYNYTHAKHILEIYRLLCQGVTLPYDQLCELFNTETDYCEKMIDYTELLKTAADEIISVFKKRSAQKLTAERGALIAPLKQQLDNLNQFELVTWLIVK
jgi:superfamily II DNA or RNA helicase